jgi:hypothetical protein
LKTTLIFFLCVCVCVSSKGARGHNPGSSKIHIGLMPDQWLMFK